MYCSVSTVLVHRTSQAIILYDLLVRVLPTLQTRTIRDVLAVSLLTTILLKILLYCAVVTLQVFNKSWGGSSPQAIMTQHLCFKPSVPAHHSNQYTIVKIHNHTSQNAPCASNCPH